MKAIKTFLKKEIKDNMFLREVNGEKYWEYIRPLVSCEVNAVISTGSPMFSKTKFNIKKYLLNISNFPKYFLKKKKYDILMISQPRRVLADNNKYRNNYIDYYVDYLKDKYDVLTLEEPTYSSLGVSDTAHSFPLYTDNIYLTDILELKFLLKKKLYKIIHPIHYKNLLLEYENIEKIVNSWYPNNDKLINFKKLFMDALIRIELERKYVKKILKVVSPKIVMLHYMPSTFKELIINECNRCGIDSIEVQHGTITKVDPLVNKCLDVSVLNNTTKYIFSFGKNQIQKDNLSINDINNVIDIGFPFFEEKLKNLKKKKKKYILVISQSTIGSDMARFASELADLVGNKYSIVFKYHPNELSNDYECLKNKNIIEIRNEMTIYEIQQEAILQIGSYSTSLYEGFAMKVPTLVLKSMFGSIEVVDIFEGINKGVYYINKPKDVLRYLRLNDIIPLDKDIKKLWQSDSKNRLLKEIEKIIGR